jgi:hypothetical protein
MLLQPAWLPCQIRNGSGNRGGVLIRYMPVVGHNTCSKINSHLVLDLGRRSIRSFQPLCSREGGVCTLQTRSLSKGFKESVPKLEAAFAQW